VDAHTWFSHGTILTIHHVPKRPTSGDIKVMQEALEFFRPETRGAPSKINDADLFKAIKAFGPKATQAQVAERLGVGESTIRAWLKREQYSWEGIKNDYLSGRIV
jgi:hypothetical protein